MVTPLVNQSVTAEIASRRQQIGALLVVLGPVLWLIAVGLVHLLYAQRVPVFSALVFRSRVDFDVSFYLDLTRRARLAASGGVSLLGLAIVVTARRLPRLHPRAAVSLGSAFAAVVVCGVVALQVIGVRHGSSFGPGLNFGIISYDWAAHGRGQLLVYLLVLGAVGLLGLARLTAVRSSSPQLPLAPILLPGFVLIAWAAVTIGPVRTGIAVSAAAALLLWPKLLWNPAVRMGAAVVLGMWLSLHVVLPAMRSFVRSLSPDSFVYYQEHYAATVLPALDVFGGAYSEIGYGHTPLILGVLQRLSGVALGGDANIVRTVALAHLLAVIVTAAAAIVLARGVAAPLLLLTVVAIPRNAFGVVYALGTPNLTGQRFLPALAGVLVLSVHASKSARDVRLIGLIAGILFGISSEIGVLVLGATAVYIMLQADEHVSRENLVTWAKLAASAIGGFLILRAGVSLHSGSTRGNTSDALRWLTGFGGVTRPVDPVAAVLVLATLGALGYLLFLRRPLEPRAALAAGILSATALYLVVFANRTHISNAWFGVVLMGLATMSLAGLMTDDGRDPVSRGRYRPAFVLLVIGLAVMAAARPLPGLPDTSSLTCTRPPVHGFCIEGEDAEAILVAIDELEVFARSETAVLSSMPTLVRSMGFNADLVHNRGIFSGPDIDTGIMLAATEIASQGVTRVIVQAPGSTLGSVSPGATGAFLEIVARVGDLELVVATKDWFVFER